MKLVCLYAYSREGLLTKEVQNGVALSRPHDAFGRPLGYVCRSADEEGETRSSPEPGDQITRLPALVGTGAKGIRDNPSPLPALSPSAREAVSTASGLRRDSGFSLLTRQMVHPTNRAPRVVEYAYDHRGRMVWKSIAFTNGPPDTALAYVWDDYNIVREDEYAAECSAPTGIVHCAWCIVHSTHNVWGLDLDGTMQGCGGVGGLLSVVRDGEVFTPAYDANGNISEYIDTSGTIVAHQEYDPFGNALVSSGAANAFTHWFSTKPWCGVTGMYEYQYRKYRPGMGRWMSRDRLGELVGTSLHAFCQNNSNDQLDVLGLCIQIISVGDSLTYGREGWSNRADTEYPGYMSFISEAAKSLDVCESICMIGKKGDQIKDMWKTQNECCQTALCPDSYVVVIMAGMNDALKMNAAGVKRNGKEKRKADILNPIPGVFESLLNNVKQMVPKDCAAPISFILIDPPHIKKTALLNPTYRDFVPDINTILDEIAKKLLQRLLEEDFQTLHLTTFEGSGDPNNINLSHSDDDDGIHFVGSSGMTRRIADRIAQAISKLNGESQ